jgi:hypothetical protein
MAKGFACILAKRAHQERPKSTMELDMWEIFAFQATSGAVHFQMPQIF